MSSRYWTDSEMLSRLGPQASAFRHLVCETNGIKIELVFESLEVSSSLPDFIRGPGFAGTG